MRGPVRVEFMPIKDGDVIELNDSFQDHTIVHQAGFKPGPARTRSGWLVLLVHEGEVPYTNYRGEKTTVSIPTKMRPTKRRGPRT